MNRQTIAHCVLALTTALSMTQVLACASPDQPAPASRVQADGRSVELSFTRSEIELALDDARASGDGTTILVSDKVQDSTGLGVTHVELRATVANLEKALTSFAVDDAAARITFVVPIDSLSSADVGGGFSQQAGDLCIYGKQDTDVAM